MMSKLRWYVAKEAKRKFARKGSSGGGGAESENNRARTGGDVDGVSAALRKKDQMRQARAANRRRIRGGAPSQTSRSTPSGSDNNKNGEDTPVDP